MVIRQFNHKISQGPNNPRFILTEADEGDIIIEDNSDTQSMTNDQLPLQMESH